MNQKSLDKNKTKELEWEKEWNKLTVKSYNLKTEKYEDEPIIFVNDKSWKKVKNFIQSLLTQQRTEILEEIKNHTFIIPQGHITRGFKLDNKDLDFIKKL